MIFGFIGFIFLIVFITLVFTNPLYKMYKNGSVLCLIVGVGLTVIDTSFLLMIWNMLVITVVGGVWW
jgi:hypothetical protein